MLISWDPAKNLKNIEKHHVRFEIAKYVFCDPFHLTEKNRIENGEQRYQTIGEVQGVLLFVIHTMEEDEDGAFNVRLISARKADRAERRKFEETR